MLICDVVLTLSFFFSEDEELDDKDSLGRSIISSWCKWKEELEHHYAITAWDLCLLPVCKDCFEWMSIDNGQLRKMIDKVVVHLHEPLCPNKKVLNNIVDEILDIFGRNLIS